MPQTTVRFFQKSDGTVPMLTWLNLLAEAARIRCLAAIDDLSEYGHELRRPRAENIGNGLYELRIKHLNVNIRILYFFHGQDTVILSHGFFKERKIPPREIATALTFMAEFKANPSRHTFQPESRKR
jgi:phage-related protein